MALDATYQAIPEDTEILRRAQTDALYAEILWSLTRYASFVEPLPPRLQDPLSQEQIALAKAALADHPGLELRHLRWGRHWDWVYYVLSETRRGLTNNETPFDALMRKAIFGDVWLPQIAPRSQSGVHFNSAQTVSDIADALQGISLNDLRSHIDVEDMSQKKVYKFGFNRDPESKEIVTNLIIEDFVKLRNFYSLVASKHEGAVADLG